MKREGEKMSKVKHPIKRFVRVDEKIVTRLCRSFLGRI